MRRFYYDFAAAYGTIWFFGLLITLITDIKFKFGAGGLICMLLVSMTWAIFMRLARKKPKADDRAADQKAQETQQRLKQIELTKELYRNSGLPLVD